MWKYRIVGVEAHIVTFQIYDDRGGLVSTRQAPVEAMDGKGDVTARIEAEVRKLRDADAKARSLGFAIDQEVTVA